MLWGKITLILAGLIGNIDELVGTVGLSSIQDYLEKALSNPKAIGVAMAGVAVVLMIARKRTL